MEPLPFRARDVGGGSSRHQHHLSSSASFRRTFHTIDLESPTHNTSKQASLPLDFIIVGAGIGGLSAAYALAASGHRVQVFEKARGLKRQPGGVHLPPNATRILTHWGVGKELLQKAATVTSSSIIDLKTGEPLGQSEWQAAYIEELGSSYLILHHADLIEILFRLASSAGARVNFGVTVESVEPARETPPETRRTSTPIAGPASRTLRPTVRLRTGEIHHADVIIGADGQRSTVRRVVTDEDEEPETISYGISYYTGTIPMTEIRKYAPLNQLLDVGSSWPIWFGASRGALAYPIRRHQEFVVHVWWEDSNVSTAASRPEVTDIWEPVTSLNSLRYEEGKMDPRLRYLLDKVSAVSRQPWYKIPLPETWVDDSESIILIGDAAHPQILGTLFGPSLALEDAALLGALFSRLRSADQVATLLYAYQDLRKGRADTIVGIEEHNVHLAFAGPKRIGGGLVRFNAIHADMPDPSQGGSVPTEAELAEIEEVWGYFAIDAADEWWVEWGLLRERSQQRRM